MFGRDYNGKDFKRVKFIHLQAKIYDIIYIEREEKKNGIK